MKQLLVYQNDGPVATLCLPKKVQSSCCYSGDVGYYISCSQIDAVRSEIGRLSVRPCSLGDSPKPENGNSH